MLRFAHISDVHVTGRPLGWRFGDFFNKRATTWLNLRCGRGATFRQAEEVLAAFARERRENGIDRIVFSGDATAFGLPGELKRAAAALGVGQVAGLAVPGNHDYLTRAAERSGEFERVFADWLHGERIGDHVYPFAQPFGPAWLVAVNSARGNRLFWDASGIVGTEQRQRLAELLARLPPGPRILVTHYPVCLKDGTPEPPAHGLSDLAETMEVAHRGGVRLWLHGHRHGPYVCTHPLNADFSSVCAGSGTQHGIWSYGDCSLIGDRMTIVRRTYVPATGGFRTAEVFEVGLDL